MCGIVGYSGRCDGVQKIVTGLEILEYRGYDSVGIAAMTDNGTRIIKTKGRVGDLSARLDEAGALDSVAAIGHTRWATHGAPSDTNAHPHSVGGVTLVHNGIVENYKELKGEFMPEQPPLSDTDTEVAAAVINYFYNECGSPVEALARSAERFAGSYALAVLFEGHDKIYAIRRSSPLILGKGSDGYYLASDITALLPFTAEYYNLAEGDVAILSEKEIKIISSGNEVKPVWKKTDLTPERAKKGGYEHFMLKEIYEQPGAVVNSLRQRVKGGLPDFSADGIDAAFWQGVKNIHIVACGSAMHAGLVGASLIERYAKVPASVYIASEYRYNPPIATEGTLVLVISQSGETADTLAALRHAKAEGLQTLAIVNAVETSIATEAEKRIYTYAGPEIAVATTKGYCTQVSVLYLIALGMGYFNGNLCEQKARTLLSQLYEKTPVAMQKILEKRDILKKIAGRIYQHDDIFYIGRGIDYSMSMEAALKLKEISYIHCEAYAAGEMKHGTISLIDEGTPVIALATTNELYDKTESNVREVRSRGAYSVLITSESERSPELSADDVLLLDAESESEKFFMAMICVQLLAYECAWLRGCDIDRPKNLAKSVTVE